MYLGLNNLGLTGLANQFSPSNLFTNGEQGAHYETYDPQRLLQRRNQLTYSSQFANAAWTRTNILSVTENADGVGDLVVPNTTSGTHIIYQNQTSIGVSNVFWVRAKPGGYNFVIVQIGGSTVVSFNLNNGTIASNSNNWPAAITAAADAVGYYDCWIAATPVNASAILYVSADGGAGGFAGDGTSGIYLARAQLEWNTTTPSAYQEVTDWNTEYLAAVGSSNVGMWQDSAGTTATYAVEQPVGKWIDTSGRGKNASQSGSTKRPLLSARVNLLTKTEQFDDAAWAKTNILNVSKNADGVGDLVIPNATVGSHYIEQAVVTASVSHKKVVRAKAGGYNFLAIQIGGANAVWFNLSTGAVGSNVGGLAATISAVSGQPGYYDCAVTNPSPTNTKSSLFMCAADGSSAFAGDGVSGVYLARADTRTSDDAAKNIPAYQRVNTSTDYDTVGFPHYLRFDGIDDSLQTGSIDLTSFDKISVWAGSTKGSDSAASVLTEFTATSSTTAGSFAIFAPDSAASTYAFRSRGATLGTNAIASGYAAPNSYVVTGLGDISGDSQDIRIDGVSANTSTTDQGTGNFANDALNIGSRNNASLFHNGRLYSLTVRASTTPTSESAISSMNRYAGNLMKIFF